MKTGMNMVALFMATLALGSSALAMKKDPGEKPPAPKGGGFTVDPTNGGPGIKAIEKEAIVFLRRWFQAEVLAIGAEREVADLFMQLADSHLSLERAKAAITTAPPRTKESLQTIIDEVNEFIPVQEHELAAAQTKYKTRVQTSLSFKQSAMMFFNIKAGNTIKAIDLKRVAEALQEALPKRADVLRAKNSDHKYDESNLGNVVWQHAAANVVAAIDDVMKNVKDYQKRVDEKDMDDVDINL